VIVANRYVTWFPSAIAAKRRRAMIPVGAGIDRRSSSVGAECVRRHLRLAFGAQGLRA
jgi:hypothetical protein